MFSWFRHNNSSVVNQKQRLLGSAENALMQVSQQHQGYMKIGEVLHLQGPRISLEALSVAIGQLQHRHPVLRSRLQINSEKPDTYLLEEDDTLQLRIREIPRKRAEHLTFWRQEWREREKETTAIGQALAQFWLLQDPEDDSDNSSPREIVVVCEHSICDGLSLSTVAHELLILLAGDDDNMFTNSLSWPVTMETAIQRSFSLVSKMITFGRFILAAVYVRATNTWTMARIPVANVDFSLTNMADHCHTETCYSILTKEQTQKLIEKCRREDVTVTSAVSSAVLCVVSTLINSEEDRATALNFSIGTDTRRRYVPPVPNHDLSYQVSGIMPFIIPTRDIPTSTEGMWQLARTFGQYLKTCVDAGQILAIGMIMGKIFQKTLDSPDSPDLPTCGISSWGILPFREQYGKWKFVGMTPFLNMIRAIMPFTTVQTVNGILTIMYVAADPVIPLSLLERLRDNTIQKLYQMIED